MEAYEKTRPAARAVGVSESFLHHNWKRIPAARKAGRCLRWDVGELKSWMKQQAILEANGKAGTHDR